ncbi:copper-activated transcription factor GRISEA [Apiospora phragmitis]|uniref:Copper-activated transcription factor GRISEA n=1 Tax=Apiospora phragmitis TaxID=2905665 RepID=A0ABR1SUM2_9PEZI
MEHPVNPGVIPLASPTRPSFRVNKAGGRPSSRKQSYVADASNRLGRMGPDSYHIINNNGFPNVQIPAEHDPMNFDVRQAIHPSMISAIDPSMASMYPGHFPYAIPPPIHNGDMSINPSLSMLNGDLAAVHGPGTPKRTASYSSEASSATFTPGSAAGPTSLEPMPPAPHRSCCAPNVLVKDSAESNGYNPMSAPGISMQMPQQPQMAAPQNNELYQSSVHGYPTGYGTYENPYDLVQWQQQQQQMATYSYLVAQEANTQDEYSHNCTCGAECECLGCPEHPFNERTREYINEGYEIQSLDPLVKQSDELPSSVLQDGSSPFATTPEAAEAGSFVNSSKEGSPAPNENFFWIEIPCNGDEANCDCGDDCACVGCATHNRKAAQNLQNPPAE